MKPVICKSQRKIYQNIVLGLSCTAASQMLLAETKAPVLEEIVVTAERKESSLQDTAISLAAFGEDKLEAEGIGSLMDLGSKVPNVSITPFPTNTSTVVIFIRGVGNADSQITQDSPVAIYTDGIYMSRSTGLTMELADLQRIEVLRGPQGTLYGRNASGGAINIVTKRPSTEAFEFSQKFTVGNRNLLTSRTSVNVPLSDTFAAKLAFLGSSSDGFVENKGPGASWGDKSVGAFRLDLRWNASENLTLDYSYDYLDSTFVNPTPQAVTPGVATGGTSDLILNTANSKVTAGPGYTSKRLDRLDSFAPLEESSNEISGHSFIATYNFENAQLKYLFATRELINASYTDLASGAADEEYRLDSNVYTAPDGTVFPLVLTEISQEQVSHEIQILGNLFNERVEYIAGVLYFAEKARLDEVPEWKVFTSPTDVAANVVVVATRDYDQKAENSAIAAYFQTTWRPEWSSDRLSVILGGRYSEDERQADVYTFDRNRIYENTLGLLLATTTEGYSAVTKRNFDDLSFSATAMFEVSEDINVYLKRIEAYKAGGFNLRDPHVDGNASGNDFGFGFVDGYDAERVTNYEFGVKSELFSRRMRVNASIYQMDYEDQQLNFTIPGNSVGATKTTNSGQATIRGLELDLTYVLTESLIAVVNYGYSDVELADIINPSTGEDQTDQFVVARTPKNTGSVSVDWTINQANWGTVSLYTSFDYADEQFYDSKGSVQEQTTLRARKLFNARLNLTDVALANGQFSAGLWARNLTDQEYEVQAIGDLPHADRAVYWGEARSFGLDVKYNF